MARARAPPANNKCPVGVCVTVILGAWLLLVVSAHPHQQQQDDDRLQQPLATMTTSQINSTTEASTTNRAKSAPGLAELNPDASDTVPVYMQHMTIILCTLHLSVFVTGLVGNSLVCLSVYRNKSLQTITNYYIVNLAVADFLVILICLPPTVIWDLTLTWNFGLVLCKLVLYLQSISVSVSVLTLTCISIDRWYAICRPLKFSSSKSRAKLTIALIWLASLLIASPDVIFLTTSKLYEDTEEDKVYMDCTYSWPEENTKVYQLCIVTLLFILPFVLMIISYSQIVNVLWRNETMAECMQNSIQLEDEAAAASVANGGGAGCGRGGKLRRGRATKNESVISTTSTAALAAAAGAGVVGPSCNGVRHRWHRGRGQQGVARAAEANQCGGAGAGGSRTDGLCSTCAATTRAGHRLKSLSPSSSSNTSYLVTPSDSFTMQSRSFAILKLCIQRGRGRRHNAEAAAPKANKACPPTVDAATAATTTGQPLATGANIRRDHQGDDNSNLALCQFERCSGDLKCLNSDDGNVVKLNVNNSPDSAACLIGIVCSGPTTRIDENMEISDGSLVNRGPPFARELCGGTGGDNNNSVNSSAGLAVTTKTIRVSGDDDDDELLKQYDNEQHAASPLPTTTTATAEEAGARRWTSSAVFYSSCNNNNNLGDANCCKHASGPNQRAKCPTRGGVDKTCICDRKVRAAGDAITKSCKLLHAAADCAQSCTATTVPAADNHDNHHDKNNRCHGCRHRAYRNHRNHHQQHRHRRATCHKLNGPRPLSGPASAPAADKIIITEIRESGPIILATEDAAANHCRLDVKTNEPCDANGANSNYYTRRRVRAVKPVDEDDDNDSDKHEAKQETDAGSGSSLAHNPQEPHVKGPAVISGQGAAMSVRSQAISKMPTRQNSAPITTSTSRTNKLIVALELPTDGRVSAAAAAAAAKCQREEGDELELERPLDGDDKNGDDYDRRHGLASEPRRKRNKPCGARLHRHHHHYNSRHHHKHRCKHTGESHRGHCHCHHHNHRRAPRLECMPTSDHVPETSPGLTADNIFATTAPSCASSSPETTRTIGPDATNRASCDSGAADDGLRQGPIVVVLTSTGNDSSPRGGCGGSKRVMAARAPQAITTTEIEANTNELDISATNERAGHHHPLSSPPESLKRPAVAGDHLTGATGCRLKSSRDATGNGGSPRDEERGEESDLLFRGDGDIGAQALQQSVGKSDAHKAKAARITETTQVPPPTKGQNGWQPPGCCADTSERHRHPPAVSGPARSEHHYLCEQPPATSLSKQQQQHGHGNGHRKGLVEASEPPPPLPRAISCDNRQSNGRLSVKLAPGYDQSSLQATEAGLLSPNPSTCCCDSSLDSINQVANDSKRRAVECMVATKFLCIKRFVRLVPSSAGGAGSHLPTRKGSLKCRACHEDLGPAQEETIGQSASSPPATTKNHTQQQQRATDAPARSSSARSASSCAQANGAAHQQLQRHAQIHNRSSAPPLQSFSPKAAGTKSCSLVVKTIPPSQQQQQHNHYPNNPQHPPPHPHPNHSSTRFYKLIESRKKAAKMLIVIVIMFGLCYLPIHFLNTLRYTTGLPQNDITTIASLVSHWLCYFNSAVNPLIYNFMSGKFRHEFANLFFCRFLRRS